MISRRKSIAATAAVAGLVGVIGLSQDNPTSAAPAIATFSPDAPIVQPVAPSRVVNGNTAQDDDRRAHYPAAQSQGLKKPLAKAEIESGARKVAAMHGGAESPSTPVKSVLMKLGDFDKANDIATDPLLSPDRVVWVATVHTPINIGDTRTGTSKPASAYTVVYDATTGDTIETGLGVDYLK